MLKKEKKVLSDEPTGQKPLRLWPGVVIVIMQWLVWLVVPMVSPDDQAIAIGVFGGLFGGVAIAAWWMFFSHAPRFDRWGVIILASGTLVLTSFIIHESIGTSMMGLMFFTYAVPVLSLAFVVCVIACRRLPDRPRRIMMIATIILSCGMWTLLRSDGMASDTGADFAWRWAETSEDRLLAQFADEPMIFIPTADIAETEAEWPGFRGPRRDGIIRGVQIETDWQASPPIELWRRSIGPGCSSFAVHGPRFYTQEQRGENELVSCYDVTTGKPVWRHSDKARFWDSHAGAGPRATPTLSNGHIYTFGGTGILNVLNAYDGSMVWSRNAVTETNAKIPGWGITSSPLVIDDLVIVAVVGRLVAYDLVSGDLRWKGPDGGESYSSPHLLTIDGVEQILLLSTSGAISLSPGDGTVLWKYHWPVDGRIVQPALTADGDLLLSGGGTGMRRIKVTHGPEGWNVEERWTSFQLKPNHYDFAIHNGSVFGFRGRSLACIDVEDGIRKWKGGNYGGFLVLLDDQDLILVLTEKGELVLVKAVSNQFTELAKIQAVEGKTWSHPVLVGDILFVRNNQEMVAFRLSLLAPTT